MRVRVKVEFSKDGLTGVGIPPLEAVKVLEQEFKRRIKKDLKIDPILDRERSHLRIDEDGNWRTFENLQAILDGRATKHRLATQHGTLNHPPFTTHFNYFNRHCHAPDHRYAGDSEGNGSRLKEQDREIGGVSGCMRRPTAGLYS